MFHILQGDADILRAENPYSSPPTKVLCDVKTPRSAVSQKKFDSMLNQGKLNKDRCCKACFRKSTGKTYQRPE